MPLVGIGTLPTPYSRASVPLPPETGGGGTLACGWGVGGSSNSDEGHTLWYSLYVRTLWWERSGALLWLFNNGASFLCVHNSPIVSTRKPAALQIENTKKTFFRGIFYMYLLNTASSAAPQIPLYRRMLKGAHLLAHTANTVAIC